MQEAAQPLTPRTTTDLVFDYLHAKIQSLELRPGTRISEAEVAADLGVSRQPVRDAFNRLGNLKLLKIRPQRATRVSGFSLPHIQNTRFLRLAIELEVLREACLKWDADRAQALRCNLDLQHQTIAQDRLSEFHRIDYDFHELLCVLGGRPLAFEKVAQCKQEVERLCVLSMYKSGEAPGILEDHESIASALGKRDFDKLEKVVRRHLSRLDCVIAAIHEEHSEYFE